MVGIAVRGRWAWVAALAFGIVLLIGGLSSSNTFLIIAGAAFAIFGLIFLILSLASGGRTD